MVERGHSKIAAAIGVMLLAGAAGCGAGSSTTSVGSSTTSVVHSSARADVALVPSGAKPAIGGVSGSGAQDVVVRVGHATITRPELESRVAIDAHSSGQDVVPTPPSYSGCIESLARSQPASPTAKLKRECAELHKSLTQSTLEGLIAGQWAIGEAAHYGMSPSEAQVRANLEQTLKRQFGTRANVNSFLAKSGENISDLLYSAQQQMAVEALFDKVKSITASPTDAAIAAYYRKHRNAYAIAETRDIGIIHTHHRRVALRVKQQLAAGVSFAKIARQLSAEQQIYSDNDGLVLGLKPHVFAERALNDAIFSSRPHLLSGPVRLDLHQVIPTESVAEISRINGYYVFEVNKITPPRVERLSQVKSKIASQFPTVAREATLSSFIHRWRQRWTARTECARGYVVRKCRSHQRSPSEPPEDLSSFT